MRLRKKKHLEERIDNSREYLVVKEDRSFYDLIENERYNFLDTEKLFGNKNPIHLEVGCGKGGFILDMAKKYPNINFLAVEKLSNVIICAIDKVRENNIKNVKFLCIDASNIHYFIPHHSVERIYLNFSCPWPKPKYKNQRLTNHRFLRLYDRLLTEKGEIWQKTDSMPFFEYSIEQFSSYGFKLKNISCDLHNSNIDYNVMTEYEKYFSGIGKPIYRLEACRR